MNFCMLVAPVYNYFVRFGMNVGNVFMFVVPAYIAEFAETVCMFVVPVYIAEFAEMFVYLVYQYILQGLP